MVARSTPGDQPPPSAAVYSPLALKLYDFVVLRISNGYAWCCSTADVLVPFFKKHIATSKSHLDIGVGNGYYLVQSKNELAHTRDIVLMDLNQNTLDVSSSRLAELGLRSESVLHDVFEPWTPPGPTRLFDSISLFYLFHCLPGPLLEKADKISSNLKHHLDPDNGVLFGATILGDEAHHNMLGRFLMSIYNKKGIFDNRDDKEADLRVALGKHFAEVEVVRKGRVALFTASRPLQALG